MKWIGWVVAVIVAIVLAASRHQGARSRRAAEVKINESLDELQTKADAQVAGYEAGLVERRKSLTKLRTETAALQTQRDELETRKQELTRKIKTLTEESERLRTTRDSMQGSSTEDREARQELQERIGQADRRVGLWKKMIEMVQLPGETE